LILPKAKDFSEQEKIAQFAGQVGDSHGRGVIRIAQFRE